jgi:pimeloyl-ACP methyl ester carboxylesterase
VNEKISTYIEPLYMNGLRGRMLCMPAPKSKKREILLLYGHHASLERMFGFAEILNKYGAVTMPDLPGFGGMDSFYKLHEDANLDAFADYLAAFIKLKYKRKRVVIVGMSFSVPIIIKTLQKYPELTRKVEYVISTVGFVHKEDFIFKKPALLGLKTLAWFGSRRLPAVFIKTFILRSVLIRSAYQIVIDRHSKLKDADTDEQKKRIDFEVTLWKNNDVRTRMRTMQIMFSLDLCNSQVNVPVYHVAPAHDRYFDNEVVKQHMQIIFRDFEAITTKLPTHAPSIVATAADAAPYVPARLRRILAKA